jgi:hypothetical protein
MKHCIQKVILKQKIYEIWFFVYLDKMITLRLLRNSDYRGKSEQKSTIIYSSNILISKLPFYLLVDYFLSSLSYQIRKSVKIGFFCNTYYYCSSRVKHISQSFMNQYWRQITSYLLWSVPRLSVYIRRILLVSFCAG